MSDFPELPPGASEGQLFTQELLKERDRKIQAWCEAAYEEAESDQKASDELKCVDSYVEYLQGTQWPSSRPSYRSKPVNNRMNRLFWEVVSLLTDMRPIVDIKATEKVPEYLDQEKLLNNRLRSWWINNNIDQKVAMTVVYGMLTTGFVKLEWDPDLHFGRGDFRLIPISPLGLLPLKPSGDLQSGQACIYQDVKSVGWLQRKFPNAASYITPDLSMSQYSVAVGAPKNVTPQLFSLLSPAMKQLLTKGQYRSGGSAYPQTKYREFWLKDYSINESNVEVLMGDKDSAFGLHYRVKPGQLLYPRGRLICMAGRSVVSDAPNPYWHGMFPFGMLRLNVVPWQLYGMSDLRQWKDLQDIVNNIFAGVMDMIKKAVNPPFFAPKTAFSEQVWNAIDFSMPGARAAYNAVSPSEPKVVPVAPLPGFVLQMLQNVEREMDQQSGIAAINEAVRKKQVPGGDTLDQIRQNQQTPIRLKARNIEIFLRDIGMQMVPNMFQFYTEKSRIFGRDNSGKISIDEEWDPSKIIPEGKNAFETAKKFDFQILEGSLLSFQKMEIATNLMKLRASGDLDRQTFFEKLSQLGLIDLDAKTVEANLIKEHQQGIAAMPPKGSKKGGGAQATVS